MRLIVGLGNPGSSYEKNRHNIGFMAVGAAARRHNFSPFQKKFQSLCAEGRLAGEKILILKPQTYMNESGRAVGEAMRFYKLAPEDVTVFYDELDLAPCKVKVKVGGGHAGHNGIRSMINHIGPDFKRVRLGIGHPGDKAKVHGHVLGDFNRIQQEAVTALTEAIADCLDLMIRGEDAKFLSQLALILNPPAKKTKAAAVGDQKRSNKGAGVIAAMKNDSKTEGPMAAALKALKKE